MTRIVKMLVTMVTAVLITFGGLAIASPASASVANGNYAVCGYGTTQTLMRDGASPRECTGQYYWLFQNNKAVIKINYPSGKKDLWGAIKNGYNATQAWCSHNSATCGLITSVGVTIVASLLG